MSLSSEILWKCLWLPCHLEGSSDGSEYNSLTKLLMWKIWAEFFAAKLVGMFLLKAEWIKQTVDSVLYVSRWEKRENTRSETQWEFMLQYHLSYGRRAALIPKIHLLAHPHCGPVRFKLDLLCRIKHRTSSLLKANNILMTASNLVYWIMYLL